jgi:hypothetical protein
MTRARRHWSPLLLAAFALYACAVPAPKPPPPKPVAVAPPPSEEAPPVAHYERRVIPQPEHKPTPPGEAVVATATAEAPPEAVPPPAEAPAEGALIGLDQKAAARLFGGAAEHAEQPPATVWRYKSDSCELDLYFYLDLKSGSMRTLHYAFKGAAQDATQRQECLRAIVDRGRQPGTPNAASVAR